MEGLEEKLGAILNDPETMKSIMAMAQKMNQQQPPVAPSAPKQDNLLPSLDPAMLQKFAGFAQQGNIDPNQQNLLAALRPYLSKERVNKLERAMRAAKMAKYASAFLNSGGLKLLTGR